jgi:hypothetical protein
VALPPISSLSTITSTSSGTSSQSKIYERPFKKLPPPRQVQNHDTVSKEIMDQGDRVSSICADLFSNEEPLEPLAPPVENGVHKRKYKTWAVKEVEKLRRLCSKGKDINFIANEIGKDISEVKYKIKRENIHGNEYDTRSKEGKRSKRKREETPNKERPKKRMKYVSKRYWTANENKILEESFEAKIPLDAMAKKLPNRSTRAIIAKLEEKYGYNRVSEIKHLLTVESLEKYLESDSDTDIENDYYNEYCF